VAVPSPPGNGFSNLLELAGFSLVGTARAWAEVMRRLGATARQSTSDEQRDLIVEVEDVVE
jgi:hypothetical protein